MRKENIHGWSSIHQGLKELFWLRKTHWLLKVITTSSFLFIASETGLHTNTDAVSKALIHSSIHGQTY